jgi:hypothetical protein
MISTIARNTVLALGATFAFGVSASAQPTGNIRSITRYTVRPDRAGDLTAAIKEYNEVLKKAGWDKRMTVWRTLTGPSELVLVTYHEKYADLDYTRSKDPRFKDSEAEMARILARINNSFEHSERIIDVVNQDLSLPRTAEPPKMILVWTGHVKEEKMHEFLELEKNEFMPAMKNAGVKVYLFSHTRFGGTNNEYRASTGIDNWAALDGQSPIRKGLGDKYVAYVAKMATILEDYHYEVYRLDSELSFIPSK